MIILTDLDETVLQFSDAFQDFAEKYYGLYIEKRLKDENNIPKIFGITEERTYEIVSAFHRSPEFGKLVPLACASVSLPDLRAAGYTFIGITCSLNEPEVVQRRKNNLYEAFGFEWEVVHCVGLLGSKHDALALYEPTIWIDDVVHHVETGVKLGHRSFLMDRPSNRHENLSNAIRVKDWFELINNVL